MRNNPSGHVNCGDETIGIDQSKMELINQGGVLMSQDEICSATLSDYFGNANISYGYGVQNMPN